MNEQKNESVSITVILDKKSYEIIEKISPELRNAAILVALKSFSTTDVCKEFFYIKNEDENVEEEKKDILNTGDVLASSSTKSANSQPNNTVAANVAVASWDAY